MGGKWLELLFEIAAGPEMGEVGVDVRTMRAEISGLALVQV
jgi:hypothetical protein